eukprot:gene7539-9822_t
MRQPALTVALGATMVALILWLFRRRQKKEVLTVSSSMSSQPQQHANNQHAQHDAAVDGLYGVCQRIEAAIVASNDTQDYRRVRRLRRVLRRVYDAIEVFEGSQTSEQAGHGITLGQLRLSQLDRLRVHDMLDTSITPYRNSFGSNDSDDDMSDSSFLSARSLEINANDSTLAVHNYVNECSHIDGSVDSTADVFKKSHVRGQKPDRKHSSPVTKLPQQRRSRRHRQSHRNQINTYDSVEASEQLVSTTAEHIEQRLTNNTGSTQQLLYEQAMEYVSQGKVEFRVDRTAETGCHNQTDFLIRLHCVRSASNIMMSDSTFRKWFVQFGRDLLGMLVGKGGGDLDAFYAAYDDMMTWLDIMAREGRSSELLEELQPRGVVCLSLFDAVVDIILLDAFDDMKNLPSTVVSALQSRWIPVRVKQQTLNSAIWTVISAKERTAPPDGLLRRLYAIFKVLSPILACGMMDCSSQSRFKELCDEFKGFVEQGTREWFQFDQGKYMTPEELSADMKDLWYTKADCAKGIARKFE